MASCLRLHGTTMLQAGPSLLLLRWHCSDSGDFRVFRASILEFRPRLGNRCTDSGHFRVFRAAILEFRPRLGNRCSNVGLHAKLISSPQRRSESDAEHRSNGGLQAKTILVAATKIRIERETSQQRRLKAKFFGRALLLHNLYYVNLLL